MRFGFYIYILLFPIFSISCKKNLPLDEIVEEGIITPETDFLTRNFYIHDPLEKDFIFNKDAPKVFEIPPHDSVNAFPDLHYENGSLFVVYRSSTKHVYGTDGVIIYEVYDTNFNFVRRFNIFKEAGFDCRDPKILRLSGDTVIVHYYAYVRKQEDGIIRNVKKVLKFLSITTGRLFKEYYLEGSYEEVPWYWHLARDPHIEGVFHSWGNNLVRFSRDLIIPSQNQLIRGRNFINLGHNPGEGRLRFNHLNYPVTLVRRRTQSLFVIDEDEKLHSIETGLGEIGGPNFIYLNKRIIIFSGRIRGNARIYKFDLLKRRISHIMDFPSKGDLGYFGMHSFGNTLFLVYYSSHRGILTKVFLSKIYFLSI